PLGEKSIAAPAADPATTPETTTAVQDNEPQPWARDAIEWAQANGIVFGDENGNLMLREPCTREQMLVFIHRALKSIGAIGG
ncbi:MAG: S-layer homology domain-containing protein, partial [Ruminococcaceae bacterium]|nr:S-layer homology domain-containing protein [Oscillospiraceae bacterium]